MNFVAKTHRFITGYDFFVSYSRKDSTKYASALAVKLIAQGFSCYLDQWGSDPGTSVPKKVLRKLTNSSVLVVLGSEAAAQSEAVMEEVVLFSKTNKTIIPVDIGGTQEAIWYSSIEGLAISEETTESFKKGDPSDGIVERMGNALNYTRQTIRIKRSILVAALIIVAAIIGIGVSTNSIFEARKELQVIGSRLDTITEESNRKGIELREKVSDLENMQTKIDAMSVEIEKTTIELANLDKEKEKIEDLAKLRALNAKEMFNRFVELNQKAYLQPTFANCDSIFDYNKLIIFFDYDKNVIPSKYENPLTKLSQCLLAKDNYRLVVEGYVGKTYINLAELERIESNTLGDEEIVGAASLTYSSPAAYSMQLAERLAATVRNRLIVNGVDSSKLMSTSTFREGRAFMDTQIFDLMGFRVELTIQKIEPTVGN